MRRFLTIFAPLMCVLYASDSYSSVNTQLWQIDWNESDKRFMSASHNESTAKDFFKVLTSILYKYEGDSELTKVPVAAYVEYEAEDYIPEGYVSSDWVDLNNDGSMELTVTSDPSGRGFYQLSIIFRRSKNITIQTFPLQRGNMYIEELFKDLDSDGVMELLIETRTGSYHGRNMPTVVPNIYKLTNGLFTDRTSEYLPLYLPVYIKSVEKEENELNAKHQETVSSCSEIIEQSNRDKSSATLSRFLALLILNKRLSDADFGIVKNWSTSPDSEIRLKSLFVLEKSTRPEAKNIINRLAEDREESVREMATNILKRH